MTATYDVLVSVRDAETGLEVFGGPLTYTLDADESSGPAVYNEPGIGDATSFAPVIPAELSDILNLFVVTSDKKLTFRFNGQTDKGITLEAGGIILLAGVTVDDGVGTNVLVNNNIIASLKAKVRCLVAGSDV